MTEIITSTHVKRFRRTNAELAALDNQIVETLRECWPQSVRHIFYRMTDGVCLMAGSAITRAAAIT